MKHTSFCEKTSLVFSNPSPSIKTYHQSHNSDETIDTSTHLRNFHKDSKVDFKQNKDTWSLTIANKIPNISQCIKKAIKTITYQLPHLGKTYDLVEFEVYITYFISENH